jgi:hypothetical protein
MRATIHLAPVGLMGISYRKGGQAVLVHSYRNGQYTKQATVAIPVLMEGAAAAEEMFDLTNNPGRQVEREEKYGRHRSVSVGDIIEVEEQPELKSTWICEPSGWKRIDLL